MVHHPNTPEVESLLQPRQHDGSSDLLQLFRSGLIIGLRYEAPSSWPLDHQLLDDLLVELQGRQCHDVQTNASRLEHSPTHQPLLQVLRTGELLHDKGSVTNREEGPKFLVLEDPPYQIEKST